MACSECEMNNRLPRIQDTLPNPVIEIHNDEELVLFHRVDVPAALGDDETNPPVQGAYKNTLVVYEANNHVYLYNSDGIYTALEGAGGVSNFDDLEGRPTYAGQTMTSSTNIPDVSSIAEDILTITNNLASEATTRATKDTELQNSLDSEISARTAADTAISTALNNEIAARQESENAINTHLDNEESERKAEYVTLSNEVDSLNSAIDQNVMTNLSVSSDTSTATVNLTNAFENLKSGETSTASVALPVASATEAGVMNSATFNAVTSNSALVNAVISGAVALNGLPASPTQDELSAAWKTATGNTVLINRASILDVSNNNTWTYYDNTEEWYKSENSTAVTVSQWTNSSTGIIKGSTAEGQIFAESDGTGSLNGYDALKSGVTTNTSDIATITNVLKDKQDLIEDLATIRSGAAKGATAVQTETDPTVPSWAKASTKPTYAYSEITGTPTIPTKTSELTNDSGYITDAPTITVTTTDPGEGSALAENSFIFVVEE